MERKRYDIPLNIVVKQSLVLFVSHVLIEFKSGRTRVYHFNMECMCFDFGVGGLAGEGLGCNACALNKF